MSDGPESAAPGAGRVQEVKQAKAPLLSAAELQALFKARLQKGFEGELAKPKEEKKAQDKPTFRNVRNLTHAQVIQWINSGTLTDPDPGLGPGGLALPLPYAIAKGAGGSAQILHGEKTAGYIRATIKTMAGDRVVGGVETINVLEEYQHRGLGILLAMTFYVLSERGGAAFVQLSTEDTSKGWWGSLGMAHNALVNVQAAIGKVNPKIKVSW